MLNVRVLQQQQLVWYAASDGGYSSYSFSYAYDTSDSGDGGDTSLCARQATSGTSRAPSR